MPAVAGRTGVEDGAEVSILVELVSVTDPADEDCEAVD